MSGGRPSVSMKGSVWRRMAYAADVLDHKSRAGWVEEAILEKLARSRAKPPPADWKPEDRRGRPKRAVTPANNFTW